MQRIKSYAALHALLLMFSFTPVFSKLAGQQEFLSLTFFLFYGVSLVILGVYAIGWQQVLKRLPLSSAYANRAVTVVWGMIWGVIIFAESIRPLHVLGSALIVAGVVLFAKAQGEEDAHDA